jgi:serine/threonine-protein kinase RsbW
MTSPAAPTVTRYQRTFHGRPDQVSQVRADITAHLGDCPAAADMILVVSEIATNAVVHSASSGEFFTVRCERHAGYVWVEVEDLGGPWPPGRPGDRPHGLDIVAALTGPGNWGTETASDGNRVVWARLDLPPGESGDR